MKKEKTSLQSKIQIDLKSFKKKTRELI